MKLVELLAKEMHEWPRFTEGGDSLEQDYDNSVIEGHGCGTVELFMLSSRADDFPHAHVTRAQWQAERGRQKGGEWKRHRGGKQPVADDRKVEVKYREGGSDIWTAFSLRWTHEQSARDVMSYRVISQPQAEEIEVIEPISTYKEFEVTGKWHQIDGPILWRDTVNELDAYIEEFTREREALINRLAEEGFALIPAMTAVMGVDDVDMSDWRNWKAGDIVECATSEYSGVYTAGQEYKVEWVNEGGFSVYDNYGGESSCDWFDHDAEGLKFVRRP